VIWLKRGFSILALAVVIYLFWPLVGEIRTTGSLFRSAQWVWLPVALAVQMVSYASLTWLNFLALKPFPGRISFPRLAALLTSIAFIEVAVPSAGGSGLVLRVRLLGQHGGYSPEAATLTQGMEMVVLSIFMGSVAVLGVMFLLRRGEVTTRQIAILAGLGSVVMAIFWGIWRSINHPQQSSRMLAGLTTVWNRLVGGLSTEPIQAQPLPSWFRGSLRRFAHPLDPAHLEARLAEVQSSLTMLRGAKIWKFLAAGVGRVVLDVATLGVCFLLFGYMIAPAALLTGYGLTLAASGLASLPGGLGLADLSIPGLFLLLGVPGPVALAAGITYRLIAYWSVRFVGFLSWQYLENKQ